MEVDDTVPTSGGLQPGPVAPRRWRVEPDLSNSVPFLAAAAVTGGAVRITGWPSVSVQPAETILDILKLIGSTVRLTDSYLEAQGPTGGYPGFDVDLHDVGELAPSVAALAALAAARLGVAADRHRAPARSRDRPAGRAEHRDQRPGR